jgi:glycerol-3-phosphate acyltransferase PlsY
MISASIAAVIFVVSFLLGSIPNGVIVGKVFYHTDIRTVGSGNIGTTNAIRALGKKGGYAVFLLDFAKGVLSGAIALAIMGAAVSVEGALTCADGLCLAFLGAGLGHIFSPWLGFKGGKGIAVCVGAMFVTFGPLAALIELALFVVVVAATKYVSAGSIAAAVLCPFMALWVFWGDWTAVVVCAIMAAVVIWAHRANIARLRAGTERRIGSSHGKAKA